MSTCEDPKAAAALGNDQKTVTPDGPVWVGYFQGQETAEFGENVDTVLEEIIKFGLSDKVIKDLEWTDSNRNKADVPSTIYVDVLIAELPLEFG